MTFAMLWLSAAFLQAADTHRGQTFKTVSGKPGDDVRPGTYRAIMRQTGIKEPDE